LIIERPDQGRSKPSLCIAENNARNLFGKFSHQCGMLASSSKAVSHKVQASVDNSVSLGELMIPFVIAEITRI
jgi:hypothetical protein